VLALLESVVEQDTQSAWEEQQCSFPITGRYLRFQTEDDRADYLAAGVPLKGKKET
jgi:hypothetical protein